jgi:hypothetical protein
MDDEQVAEGLGVFSIALGLTEAITPGGLGRPLGMENRKGVLRGFGLREVVAGVGILASRKKGPWVWARVAGDALDLAMLGTALTPKNPKRGRVALALAVVAAITVLDVVTARGLGERGG